MSIRRALENNTQWLSGHIFIFYHSKVKSGEDRTEKHKKE